MAKYTHSVPKRTDVYDTARPRQHPTRVDVTQLLREINAGIRYFWHNPKRARQAAEHLKILQRKGSGRYSLNSVEDADPHGLSFNP